MLHATERSDQRKRLTNRSAWLSIITVLSFFVGLMTIGTTVQKTEDAAARAASGAPFAIALGGALWARATRTKLRALESVEEGPTESGS